MRTTTTAQDTAHAALDRATHFRVELADADGAYVNVCDLFDQDWLDDWAIDVDTDNPIGELKLQLKRRIGIYSMSPLDEDSEINRDSGGAYAPFLHPYRGVKFYCATMLQGEAPAAADWVWAWEGITRKITSNDESVTVECLDPMRRLMVTFIDTVAGYGDDAGTLDVEDVAQDILDAEIASPAMTLVSAATAFPIRNYPLGNVTVFEALAALRDHIGFNLHWRWNSGASAFRLTLWDPARTSTTALYTFGGDDYFTIPSVSLEDDGIRNEWEVVFLDTDGVEDAYSDTDAASIALYQTRFGRIDARGTSVVTTAQATVLVDFALSDTASPPLPMEVVLPFFWPVELGDLYEFEANDHFTTAQKLAVLGFRHTGNAGDPKTVLRLSGKPSGGYARWHQIEQRVAFADTPKGTYETDPSTRAHTGTTSETTKWTFSIPAGKLGTKGGLRITIRATTVGTAGDKTLRFKLNGTSWLDYVVAAAIADDFEFTCMIFNNNATADQRIFTRAARDLSALADSLHTATDAEDSTATMTVTLTVELANAADTVNLTLTLPEYIGVAA